MGQLLQISANSYYRRNPFSPRRQVRSGMARSLLAIAGSPVDAIERRVRCRFCAARLLDRRPPSTSLHLLIHRANRQRQDEYRFAHGGLHALRVDLAGKHVEKGRVLFFAGENPDDVRTRWIKQCEELKQSPDVMDVIFLPGTPPISNDAIRKRIDVEGCPIWSVQSADRRY